MAILHRTRLIPFPSPSAYSPRPRIRSECIARCTCLRPGFHWYSLRLPRRDGQAELTWMAGYTLQTVANPVTNLARRRVRCWIYVTTTPRRHTALEINWVNFSNWKNNKHQRYLVKRGIAVHPTPRLYSPGSSSNLQWYVLAGGSSLKSPLPLRTRDPHVTKCHRTPQVYYGI